MVRIMYCKSTKNVLILITTILTFFKTAGRTKRQVLPSQVFMLIVLQFIREDRGIRIKKEHFLRFASFNILI